MLRVSKRRFALTAALLSLCAIPSRANDGGIAWGGSPRLLSSHPSVAMQSEIITMNVGKENVSVDCRFVFKNYGRATTVRMGFPDEGRGDTPHQTEFETRTPGKKAVTAFTSFKSWVNGVPVKTQLIRSNESQLSWHAKSVFFPESSTRIVRDLYTVPVGGQIGLHGYYHQTSYTLHTGASWRGAIRRSEIIVNFINTGGANQLNPVSIRSLKAENDNVEFVDWSKLPRGTIIYKGNLKPTAKGRTLRFVRTNWNPTEQDDIFLAFNPRGNDGKPVWK
ncbi:MAG TPA: DUF4424 family protein [Abditibacteriaceae bacterium]|jgi:hypothetical protein|nr:DUF4424 family protein [Abditibacteriaceae bacterium]